MSFPLFLMLFIAMGSIMILIAQFSYKLGLKKKEREMHVLQEESKKKSLDQQRHVIKGKVSEQIAPFLPGFPFKASECRFLGSPIDFVVFKGMDQGIVESVYLVDVKTGNARLSKLQRSICEAVEAKRVYWYTYRTGKEFYSETPPQQQANMYNQNLYEEPTHVGMGQNNHYDAESLARQEYFQNPTDYAEPPYNEENELQKLMGEIEGLKHQRNGF